MIPKHSSAPMHNALSQIDEVISHLTRVCPGVGASFKASSKSKMTFTGCLSSLSSYKEGSPLKSLSGAEVAGLYLTRSVLEVLYDFFPMLSHTFQFEQFEFLSRVVRWPMENFIKNAKFITAYPMDRFLGDNEIVWPDSFKPDDPNYFGYGPLVFSGRIKRMLKLRLVSHSSHNLRLWAGYLQGVKRGCQSAPTSFILKTMKDHHEKLLRTYPDEGICPLSNMWDSLFYNFEPTQPRLYEASASASWGTFRSTGGAREFLRDKFSKESSQLLSILETDKGVTEVFGKAGPSFDRVLDSYVIPLRSEFRTSSGMSTLRHGPLRRIPLRTRVEAVLEPLKVRLITKGESIPYWLSKSWQKDLWSYMQSFPQLALTGEPVRPGHLDRMMDFERKLDLDWDNPFFVSGDYSAATDLLRQDYTKSCSEAVLEKLFLSFHNDPSWISPTRLLKYIEILRSVLYEQEVSYPDKYVSQTDSLNPFVQKNGQLMGSTLSFPFLCFINLACYKRSLEIRFSRKFTWRQLPVLVNGDDILFRADQKMYEIWKFQIGCAGFELSFGKNYRNPQICCICSEFFIYHSKSNSFERIGYLNCGLLMNVSKLQHSSEISPVWDNYNYLISNSVNQARTRSRFFHYNLKRIRLLTSIGPSTTLNCFIPRPLGGLGFLGEANEYTNFQRRLARWLYLKTQEEKPQISEMISLVSLRDSMVLYRPHNPHIILQPRIGPLMPNTRLVRDLSIRPPLFASRYETTELTYRFNYKTLHEFRNDLQRSTIKPFPLKPKRLSGVSLLSFPYILTEYIGAKEPVYTIQPSWDTSIWWHSRLWLEVAPHELTSVIPLFTPDYQIFFGSGLIGEEVSLTSSYHILQENGEWEWLPSHN